VLRKSTPRSRKWYHGLDLKARKGGETEWKDAKKYGVEVFEDANNGNLVYITENRLRSRSSRSNTATTFWASGAASARRCFHRRADGAPLAPNFVPFPHFSARIDVGRFHLNEFRVVFPTGKFGSKRLGRTA